MELIDNRVSQTKKSGKLAELIKKIKNIKNIEVIIGVFILAVVLLIYAAAASKSNTEKTASTEVSSNQNYLETEQKLASILSGIKGDGSVKVMITYDGTTRLVTAESSTVTQNTKTDSSGGGSLVSSNSTTTTSPVFSGSEVVVLKQLNPEILGVIIVAKGAADISVRMQLISATATALCISPDVITVATGEFKG